MPALVRCKHCGKDYAYRDDIERMRCDNCDSPLNQNNTRMILTLRTVGQADPLDGM